MNKSRNVLITIVVSVLAAAIIFGSGLWWGIKFGSATTKNIQISDVSGMSSEGSAKDADFSTFWQAWQTIHDNYLKDSQVNSQARVYGAIRGLTSSMGDPYTVFFDPKESKDFQDSVSGKGFGGVGIELGMRKDQLMVIAPLKKTPADKAGIKSGDWILKINATSTQGLSIDEAVNMIRGPEGTEVKLMTYREGWDSPKEVKLTRATIDVPTIDLTMNNDGIAHVQLYSFNGNAANLFYNTAMSLIRQGAKGIVLDLRNNPGGYVDAATDIAGWFVPRGTLVVSEAGRSDSRGELRASGNDALGKLPIVVLMNGGSASASEILAGALRDQRQAKLIGEQSFGKGTVQEVYNLKDGSSIKITIAHWVMPSGRILDSEGLKPDYEIKLTEDDFKNGRDPQLDKALDILKGEISNKK